MMLAKSTWASHWSCLKSVTVDWDLCAGVVRIALLKLEYILPVSTLGSVQFKD